VDQNRVVTFCLRTDSLYAAYKSVATVATYAFGNCRARGDFEGCLRRQPARRRSEVRPVYRPPVVRPQLWTTLQDPANQTFPNNTARVTCSLRFVGRPDAGPPALWLEPVHRIFTMSFRYSARPHAGMFLIAKIFEISSSPLIRFRPDPGLLLTWPDLIQASFGSSRTKAGEGRTKPEQSPNKAWIKSG